jgi:uncharacterized protein (TIRG00374 family)
MQSKNKKRKIRVLEHPLVKVFKKLEHNYVANFSEDRYFTLNCPEKIKEFGQKKLESEKEEVNQNFEQANRKKKRIQNLIFFLVNIAVLGIILAVQLSEGNVDDPTEMHANWWFLLAAFGMFCLGMIFEQLRYMVLTYKAIGIPRPHISYKVAVVGKYYDVLTPFAVGGQPFQIFYLQKYGIPGGSAISIIASKYIFSQLSYFLLATVFLFVNLDTTILGVDGALQGVIYTSAWVGYSIIFLLIAVVVLVSMSKKIGMGLVLGCIKLFCKMFRRDHKKMVTSTVRTVTTWQTTMRAYSKSPFVLSTNMFLSIAHVVAMWMIPFFIYCAFEGWDPNMIITIFALIVMTELAASIMPLPGGTGMSEVSFMALFGALFVISGGGAVFWAMLIWKLLSYYSYIIQGFLLLTYDFIVGNKRLSKYKAYWMSRARRFGFPKKKDS